MDFYQIQSGLQNIKMNKRETIQEKLTFPIKGAKDYKPVFCTWG